MRPPRHLGFHHLSIALALVLSLSGCSSWHSANVTPAQLLDDDPPDRVRVTKPDGTTLVLEHPQLLGDTLYGAAARNAGSRGDTVAVPLADLRKVEVRQPNGLKTIGLVLGLVTVATGIYLAILLDNLPTD